MNFNRKKPQRRLIDLTPMIDVVFLILLFFVVSSILNIQRTLDIQLPVAETGKKNSLASPPVINITKNSELVMDGKKIEPSKLVERLRAAYEIKKNQVLIIRSDGNVKHQTVVFVMDSGKKAGFSRLSIVTIPSQ